MPPSQSPSDEPVECDLLVRTSSGKIVPFDIQSAEPGSFTKPAAVDMETYKPGSLVETAWVYYQGDPQEQTQPEHPFERPFKDDVTFSIDLVRDEDTSKVLQEIMPTANPYDFWKHSMPFTARGNHSVNIYSHFPKACKYYSFGTLSFDWVVPEDVEEDSVFRLKLTTESPSTTHLSGKLRLSHADAATPSEPVEVAPMEPTPVETEPAETAPIKSAPIMDLKPVGVSRFNVAGLSLAVVVSILLACLVGLRLRRRSKQIVLG